MIVPLCIEKHTWILICCECTGKPYQRSYAFKISSFLHFNIVSPWNYSKSSHLGDHRSFQRYPSACGDWTSCISLYIMTIPNLIELQTGICKQCQQSDKKSQWLHHSQSALARNEVISADTLLLNTQCMQ